MMTEDREALKKQIKKKYGEVIRSGADVFEEIKDLKRKSIMLDPLELRTYEFTKPLYEKNYQCMLKRIKEFTKFINQFDPDAMIVIQSDHGTHDAPKLLDDQGEYLNKIFTNNVALLHSKIDKIEKENILKKPHRK